MRATLGALGRITKAAGQAAGILAAAGVLYTAADEDSRRAAIRGGRVAKHAIPMAWGYSVTLSRAEKEFGKDSDEYRRVKEEVDTMGATHLLQLANENGGAFTKFAQAMSMNNTLPLPYVQILSTTQDKAASKDWSEVKRVFEEDLNMPAEQAFKHIETTPVAAASLAQVHKAITHEGNAVAVKIQYPELRRDSRADMSAIYFCSLIVELMFPEYGYTWLVPEFAASLRNELNFLQEARNGERVAEMFRGNDRVHIPAIVPELTSERVLTMEWIDGVKVNDREGLKSVGVTDTRDVAQAVVEFLSQQIFVDGFSHLDLHPGNLFVRRTPKPDGSYDPNGRPQLVPIDWGMVRRLSPAFRQSFCDLWVSLILSQHEQAIDAILKLGMERSHHEALSLILVYRPVGIGGRTSALGGKWSQEDVERLRAAGQKLDKMEINRFMQRLPRDLLFLLRAINFMRSLNQSLGGTTYERFTTMGQYAVKGRNLPSSPLAAASASAVYANVPALMTTDVLGGPLDDIAAEAIHSATDPLGATTGGVLHGLLMWLKTALQREPVREPVTYVNAMSSSTLDNPTESEILKKKDAVERANNPIYHYLFTKPGRWFREQKDLVRMQGMLLVQDLVWKLIMGGWVGGGFKPFEGDDKSRDPWKGKNPG